VVDEKDLTPQTLAAAVDRAVTGPPAGAFVDTAGAARSAALISAWADELAWS